MLAFSYEPFIKKKVPWLVNLQLWMWPTWRKKTFETNFKLMEQTDWQTLQLLDWISLRANSVKRVTVTSSPQRWKNLPICEEKKICKKNSVLGKIFAKFYTVLSRKWVISQFYAFWCIVFAHFGTLCNFLTFFHYLGLLGLLRCFVAN